MFEDWNPHKWELAMRIGGEARFKYLTAQPLDGCPIRTGRVGS
jgi:hypothetical protein